MDKKEKNKQEIRKLFSEQSLAVLATQSKGQPHTSLIGFTSTENLKTIVFVTKRSTHKYQNIMENPKVSLLIDNRTNQAEDFQSAEAVTVYGKAKEIPKHEEKELLDLYVKKHPYLIDFAQSPDSALINVEVYKFSLVSQLNNVNEVFP